MSIEDFDESQIHSALTNLETLDQALEFLLKKAATDVDVERATFFAHDKDKAELFSLCTFGDSDTEIRMKDDEGIAGKVFHHGVPMTVDDTYQDDWFNYEIDRTSGFETRSLICVPVFKNRVVVGVIQLLNRNNGYFDADDEAYLQKIAMVMTSVLSDKKYTTQKSLFDTLFD